MATQFRRIDFDTIAQRVRISWEMVTQADDSADSPPDRDEGFWPSIDPESPGYIGGDAATVKQRWAVERDKAMKRYTDWANDVWGYVGVIARARIFIPCGGNSFATYTMDSPGLWGIESDSGAYLREVFEEQKAELRSHLETLAKALIGAEELAEEDSE